MTTTDSATLIAEAIRLMPDLDKAKEELDQDPKQFMSDVFPEADLGTRAVVGAGGDLESPGLDEVGKAIHRHREDVVGEGMKALEKVRDQGEGARLEPQEAAGLEAIVNLTARPAILIKNGKFLAPPPPPWESLENDRASIDGAAASVGRVQLKGNVLYPWVGTAFLVADDVIMTNAHVADVFVSGRRAPWTFLPGMTSSVNYFENPDEGVHPEFEVTDIIGVHDRFDLALFRVKRQSGDSSLPEPLRVASEVSEPMADRTVYVLGYPAHDSRNGEDAMRLIFADKYNVKRLQPGKVLADMGDAGLFNHDCSTLGGNSGSCVIDLETNNVIGLHFQGEYLRYNQAVSLWELDGDPLLVEAGVEFN